MRRVILAVGVLVSLVDASAQEPGVSSSADPRPAFDVTSVKPAQTGDLGLRNRFTPLRISWDNAPLKVLIQIAYDVAHYQITGGASWIDADRFEVIGTVESGDARPTMRPRMQRLLEDRFGLRVRRQPRPMPVYLLLRLREDGLGPGLKVVKGDCTRAPGRELPCPLRIEHGVIEGTSVDWSRLALPLNLGVERPVLDRTGLSGQFDIKLQWTDDPTTPPSDVVSVFTALREQAGLELRPSREPIEMLVIDSIERPTPD